MRRSSFIERTRFPRREEKIEKIVYHDWTTLDEVGRGNLQETRQLGIDNT